MGIREAYKMDMLEGQRWEGNGDEFCDKISEQCGNVCV